MADVDISKFRAQVVRDGFRPSNPGFVESEGQNPVDPAGSGQNHLPVTIEAAATGLTITESQVLGGAGTVGQYIRGDGSLADFPASTGGGSSVSYYLNGSVSQGTIGAVDYKELSKAPVFGAGTDISINADGYIASFLTDANDPNLLEIPGGNWNLETYFSASSSGGNPSFYVELYKYNGTTFTLIASSQSAPELIAFGTNLTPYFSTLAVPTTTLAATDRLAMRYYVTHSGRTITLHTENNHLCQVITTFTTGLTALNGLTDQVQFLQVGTAGTDFNISSASSTHTFNLPTASATNRGALSSSDWTTFNNKMPAITFNAPLFIASGGEVGITQASGSVNGFLSSTDWTTFNNKQNALGFTPVPQTRTLTINGNAYDLSVDRSWTVGDMILADVQTVTGRKDFNTNTLQLVVNGTSQKTILTNSPIDSGSYSLAINALGFNASNNLYFSKGGNNNGIFAFSNAATRTYTLKDASGTLAFTSDIPVNPVGGTGTTNTIPKFTGGSTIGNSNLINDASGNLGLGVTPSAWASGFRAIQMTSGTSLMSHPSVPITYLSSNYLATDLGPRYIQSDGAARFLVNGWQSQFTWETAPSGTAGNAISFTQAMTLTSGGNLLVGTTTDNGAKLQVSGASTFSSSVTAPLIYLTRTSLTNSNPLLWSTSGTLDWFLGSSPLGNSTSDLSLYSYGTSSVVLHVAKSSGNVGIGTASPGARLDVTTSFGSQLIVGFSGNPDNFYDANNHFFRTAFGVSNTLSLVGSNVGIGVTPSAWSLSGLSAMQIQNAGFFGYFNETGITQNAYFNSGWKYIATGNATEYLQVSGEHRFFTAPSGTAGNAISFTQAMTLTSGGNLLVGTTTDNGARLQVSGTATFSSSVTANGTATFLGQFGNGNNVNEKIIQFLRASAATNIVNIQGINAGVGASDIALQALGGNVGIGTTEISSRLHVSGTMRNVLNSGAGGQTLIAAILGVSNGYLITVDTSNNITHTWHTGANAVSMGITSGGNVLIGTSTSGASRLRIVGLPTSSAGLSAGDVWNNGGDLRIV